MICLGLSRLGRAVSGCVATEVYAQVAPVLRPALIAQAKRWVAGREGVLRNAALALPFAHTPPDAACDKAAYKKALVQAAHALEAFHDAPLQAWLASTLDVCDVWTSEHRRVLETLEVKLAAA